MFVSESANLKELVQSIRNSVELLTDCTALKRDLGRLPNCPLKSSLVETISSIEALSFSIDQYSDRKEGFNPLDLFDGATVRVRQHTKPELTV